MSKSPPETPETLEEAVAEHRRTAGGLTCVVTSLPNALLSAVVSPTQLGPEAGVLLGAVSLVSVGTQSSATPIDRCD